MAVNQTFAPSSALTMNWLSSYAASYNFLYFSSIEVGTLIEAELDRGQLLMHQCRLFCWGKASFLRLWCDHFH